MKWMLALLPSLAVAQPFVEVGIGAGPGGCMYDGYQSEVVRMVRKSRITTDILCSRNPLGLAAIGYQFSDQWRVQLDHWSSLQDRDRGVEILSIRYRYTFK